MAELELTVPTLLQLAPLFKEYCQRPSVDALAVFSLMAAPASELLSASVKEVRRLPMLAPPIDNASSSMAASVEAPVTGASGTLFTVIDIVFESCFAGVLALARSSTLRLMLALPK